jgi:calcium-dependent protein kinase
MVSYYWAWLKQFENIMFVSPESWHIKIIDFGLSARFQKGSPLHRQVGTFHTMSPETFQGNYGSPADLWSVGVIAYELMCGRKPWTAKDSFELIQQVCRAQYSLEDYQRFPRWAHATPESKDFCQSLIQKDPSKRPTALQALQHPWMTIANQHTTTKTGGSEPSNVASSSSGGGGAFRRKSGLSEDFRSSGQTNKLVAYARMPQLQRIATLMVAHSSEQAVPQQVEELRRLFEEYDRDGTGVIRIDEFQSAFVANSNTTAATTTESNSTTDACWKEVFDGMDAYHDQVLSYTEFLAAALTVFGFVKEEQIVASFEQLDTDASGAITVENLKVLLGRDFTEDTATRMLQEMDITKDGKVSLEEFLAAFRKQ